VVTAPRSWDGGDYQARFDALAAQGVDVHGEVRFVLAFAPTSVLDAGCGTGRVALELSRRGIDATGVDLDPSMLATARNLGRAADGPEVRFVEADLADPGFHLGRTFDVVVMAGNVPLFTPPGTQAAVVAGCSRHVRSGGLLVAGFQLDRGYGLAAYDAACVDAGLALVERWATWDREPMPEGVPTYAVSVHGRHE